MQAFEKLCVLCSRKLSACEIPHLKLRCSSCGLMKNPASVFSYTKRTLVEIFGVVCVVRLHKCTLNHINIAMFALHTAQWLG